MNKYQEALDIFLDDTPLNDDTEYWKFYDKYKETPTDVLLKLVVKEIPMKVTDIHVDEFYCPNCYSEITHHKYDTCKPKYCNHCGQMLDWSDKND